MCRSSSSSPAPGTIGPVRSQFTPLRFDTGREGLESRQRRRSGTTFHPPTRLRSVPWAIPLASILC
jgi:hypothetical protein